MLLHPKRGFGCALRLWMENQPLWCCFEGFVLRLRLLVASVPGSPAGGCDGRACRSIRSFVVRPLVVPRFEFWRPGVLCGSPVRFTLRQLKSSRSSSTRSRWLLCGLLLPLLVAPSLEAPQRVPARYLSSLRAGDCTGIDGRLSSPPSGVADVAVSYTLNALCIRSGFISGQSWPLLVFPLCGFSAGLCRSSLASPSRCRSESAPAWHR